MAVMRVHKNQNYTVMSNFHFREKKMSLKAKGLLSLMLSLPDNWDYSIAGLVTLSKDGRDSVMTALQELEKFGYLKRTRVVNEKGQFEGYDYDIFECPQIVDPKTENPKTEKPKTENHEQLSNKELNTNLTKDIIDKKDKAIALPEPNIFIKELVKNNYIEHDEIFMDQYNYFIQEVADEHGFEITRACVMYFVQRATGFDANGEPIQNKFKYFKDSVEFGLKKISPYSEPENFPNYKDHWLYN